MRKIAILALTCVALLAGCMTVGRWLAPIQVGELDQAAQDMVHEAQSSGTQALADVKAGYEKIIAGLKAQITKLQNAKPPSPYKWVFVGGVALGILGFAASVFCGIAGWITPKLAAAGAGASIGVIVLCGAFDRYGGPIFLGFAILLGVVALGAIGYGIWTLKKSETNKATTLDTIIPAIEAAEPKKEGAKPSGPIKASIASIAKHKGTSDIILAEVSKAKARTKIAKEEAHA